MTEIVTSPTGEETPSVLIVGDISEEVARARRILERYCFRVLSPSSIEEALHTISKEAFVVVISDEVFDGERGVDFLRRVMAIDLRTRRILIGAPEASLLAASINQGWLYACLPKPFDSRTLSQATLHASEAYSQKEEQRRLIEELRYRVQELESEVRLLSSRLDSVKSPSSPEEHVERILEEDHKLLGIEHYDSKHAIPVKIFGDLPPKPFQSALVPPTTTENFVTERDLLSVRSAQNGGEKNTSNFSHNLILAVERLIAGLSAGAPPEETAWGLASLVLLEKDQSAMPAIKRATARLVGLAGSGRGGSIAAWALGERFFRTQAPAERDLAEASLAWVSLPSLSTPDLVAAGSLLALVAGAETGLLETVGAAERLRSITSRVAHTLHAPSETPLLVICLLALANYDLTEIAKHLATRQRQSGALAGEIDLPDSPPLVTTAISALVFGIKNLKGAVVNVLRSYSTSTDFAEKKS